MRLERNNIEVLTGKNPYILTIKNKTATSKALHGYTASIFNYWISAEFGLIYVKYTKYTVSKGVCLYTASF